MSEPVINTSNELLFSLKDAALRIRDRRVFEHTNWDIRRGERWVIVGPNGSGKSTLAGAINRTTPVVAGNIYRHPGVISADATKSIVSPEAVRRLVERDFASDHSRYVAGRPWDLTTAKELLPVTVCDSNSAANELFLERYDVNRLLHTTVRALSSGELKRLFIVRSLLSDADILIFDEPFDGLDADARTRFAEDLECLSASAGNRAVVLISHRTEEIPAGFDRVLLTDSCRVKAVGGRELLGTCENLPGDIPRSAPLRIRPTQSSCVSAAPVIEMRNLHVSYGDLLVFDGLDWTVRDGENWRVFGPNGSGKTTLLDLIHGDNLQAYANDVRVFGVPRGAGESIWELREKIGYVTGSLNVRHAHDVSVEDVIASGFFSSVGLYRRPNEAQENAARALIRNLGLTSLAERSFRLLSAGERAMVLVARAFVKRPALLILDEPCQGLDVSNRRLVLEAIDNLGRMEGTNLIYVTHHADEIPLCISHTLHLPSKKS